VVALINIGKMEKIDSKHLKLAREQFEWLLNKKSVEAKWQKIFV
jgi:hypothetical protein